jgi:hypothetical protein
MTVTNMRGILIVILSSVPWVSDFEGVARCGKGVLQWKGRDPLPRRSILLEKQRWEVTFSVNVQKFWASHFLFLDITPENDPD